MILATPTFKVDTATSDIPVIALTAHALAAGSDDYEPKPINFPRLVGKIEQLLARDDGGARG